MITFLKYPIKTLFERTAFRKISLVVFNKLYSSEGTDSHLESSFIEREIKRKSDCLVQLLDVSSKLNTEVRMIARVQFVRMVGKKLVFLKLRQGLDTFQAIISLNPKQTSGEPAYCYSEIMEESIVSIKGMIRTADVKGCSIKSYELQVSEIKVIEKPQYSLPLSVEELSREETIKNDQIHSVPLEKRLDFRSIDLRTCQNVAIFTIKHEIVSTFRKYLNNRGFIEIQTPKLTGGKTEGNGAEVFEINYFDRKAYLVQSPQLYKQMAVCAGLQKVYEIGPVFRAEKSHTKAHLTEFTSMDIEMVIENNYYEVIEAVDEIIRLIVHKLDHLKKEKNAINSFYDIPSIELTTSTPIIKFKDAMNLLGQGVFKHSDITKQQERQLAAMIKQKHNTDLFILTEYPISARPFYTMPSFSKNNKDVCTYSKSFDIFLKGEEIVSGGERINNYDLLMKMIKEKKMDSLHEIKSYLDSFKYAAPKHGGAGLGLERLLSTLLGLNDVRRASLFPRDPKRLLP